MNKIDYNIVMQALLSIDFSKELVEEHILQVTQDFEEGVEFDYLITRLYLLNIKVKVDQVRILIWKLIAHGQLDLTVNRKLKYIQKKE